MNRETVFIARNNHSAAAGLPPSEATEDSGKYRAYY